MIILLPLPAGDQEPTIDLNWLLTKVYDQAALELAIDYSQAAVSALAEDDWQWLQTLLARSTA